MPVARPVICLETGQRFESTYAAALAMGNGNLCVSRAARDGSAAGGYHWYFADQPRPAESDLKRRGKGRGSAVVCYETGQTYPSVAAAAEAVGCCRANIIRAIKDGVAARGFHWHYADQARPAAPQFKRQRSLPVVCRETGQRFESISAAAKAVGTGKSCISDALLTGLPSGGFHWDPADTSEGRRRRSGHPVICVETGERFERIIDAIAAVGGNRIGIGRALRNGDEHRGFHWRYDSERGGAADA